MARQVPQMLPLPGVRGHTNIDSMRDEVATSVQNNFIGGLKTEFTGLNFPPNACTDADNTIFTITGDVTRREGFDYEANFTTTTVDRTNKAITEYLWKNVGGDGLTQLFVTQIGSTLYFYWASNATTASPLSTQQIVSTVSLSSYLAQGSSSDPSSVECQYTDGNGYLFIYHPMCDPIYCSYAPGIHTFGTVTATRITIQIRDTAGIPETGVPVQYRPITLTAEHNYNIQNQGWTRAPLWTAVSVATTITNPIGSNLFNIASGLNINVGDPVVGNGLSDNTSAIVGTVVSYVGTSLTVSVSTFVGGNPSQQWGLSEGNTKNLIDTWHSQVGNYPSNADIWYSYKDSTGTFNPASTLNNVSEPTSQSPEGHFILNAFTQQRSLTSGIAGITDVTTLVRPRTGTWFQGRVWYTGVDSSQIATGDQPYYTWTENIYFSQVITDATQFGSCYQTNDPSDENLFNELPTDGGIIVIQGAGAVYKLFPIQNGMLVFAANGIWFITGSQGIGFAANDYTVTKISAVRAVTSNTYVDVNGLPIFWNEEGIYTVEPAQQGLGLSVVPITVGTIKSFFNQIPRDSKKYAKGDYNPISYIVQWVYKSLEETDITSRYEFDRILCFNTYNKAFYTYTISNSGGTYPYVHGVTYVTNPGGSDAPDPIFKYHTSVANSGSYKFTFSEENDSTYVDWLSFSSPGLTFTSYFVTAYSLAGQGLRKFQPNYVYVYSRNPVQSAYTIQGIWDFANSNNSGSYSSAQQTSILTNPYYNMTFFRHRIRGHGVALQLKFTSVDNYPYDFMGWSMWITENSGV